MMQECIQIRVAHVNVFKLAMRVVGLSADCDRTGQVMIVCCTVLMCLINLLHYCYYYYYCCCYYCCL